MKHFAFTCQGESHKATDKPCQDYSYSLVEEGLCIAIVCDGHGGERYFRSDVGSNLCAEITAQSIRNFVEDVDPTIFEGQPLTKRKVLSEFEDDKLNLTDIALRQLFSSIISKWNEAIVAYSENNPITEREIEKVQPKYIESFENLENLEKIYGCTLMAYVQTPTYWFAFHIGDGKCVSFQDDSSIWQEPVEWDEDCFLNRTTSICDSNALNKFRYTYCGDGTFPIAVFLGSDGMDDSFGPMENLVDFYMQVTKMLAKDDEALAQEEIVNTLPILSKRGSQDDMSLAYIYDDNRINDIVRPILEAQIARIKENISNLVEAEKAETKRYESLEDATTRKDIIDRDYAYKKMVKLIEQQLAEVKKLNERVNELTSLPVSESKDEV